MTLRVGSLGGELETVESTVLELLLEDYKLAHRREHCSRQDFAAGWLAAMRRLVELGYKEPVRNS
jgi:hypothetical protein